MKRHWEHFYDSRNLSAFNLQWPCLYAYNLDKYSFSYKSIYFFTPKLNVFQNEIIWFYHFSIQIVCAIYAYK